AGGDFGLGGVAMLQLLMALAFSAAPLTLYVPPVRSLSLFVEAIEAVFRDCAPYSQGAIFRFRLGLSRILSGLARALR
ncbi:Os03g0174800, partial [Oryza sativa Japonica Group]